MTQKPVFNEVGERFIDYYSTVRGYVRQEVTRHDLVPYLNPAPLTIADVGGGDGRDSEWLALQGHDVTLVEPAVEMIKRATRRDKRIHIVHGDERVLLHESGEAAFDVVLSHGVLMYELNEPQAQLDRLLKLLKPGGILSLLTKGYGGAFERLKRQGKTNELDGLKKTHQFVQNKDKLGQRVWAFSEVELDEMIKTAGARVLEWAGVRIESDEDARQISEVPKAELDAIVAQEIALAHDPARRTSGQMLHFIARRS